MGIFKFNKKKPKKIGRRPSSPELEEKKLDNKKKKLLQDAMFEQAHNDPAFMRQLILNQFGVKMPPEDPSDKATKELKATLTQIAVDKIKNNPGLAERYAEREIEKIAGSIVPDELGHEGCDGDGKGRIRDLIEELDDAQELSERLGKNKGGLGQLLSDPDVVKAIAGVFGQFLAPKPGGISIDSAEYKEFLEFRQRKQIPSPQLQIQQQNIQSQPTQAIPIDKVQTISPIENQQVQIQQIKQDVPTTKKNTSLGLASWMPYLEKEPYEFMTELLNRMENGTEEEKEQTKFVFSILGTKTAEEILAMLTPFKEDTNFGEYIKKLEEKKDWLEQLIALVKVQGVS